MNAPQFLRRNQPTARREPLLHPVDLDQAAEAVDFYAGKAKQQRTEAQAVGDIAEQAVLRATQLSKEVTAMIDKAKAVTNQIESEGLRLIAEVQRQQDEFNKRTEAFIESATTLHNGLLDTLAKVGKTATPQTVEPEPLPAAELEADITEVVNNKTAARQQAAE